MNLQDLLKSKIQEARNKVLSTSEQINLGDLIKLLKGVTDKDKEVYFDFSTFFPSTLDSWRGAYEELALGIASYAEGSTPLKASKLLDMLEFANGHTFEGYKGGDFVMNENTPLWVANYGDSGNTGVVGLKETSYNVFILTSHCDY